MSSDLARLEPRSVWGWFAELARVPRPSKREEKAVAWALDVAGRLKLATRRDAVGNVVVVVPATPGRESAPTLVLQAHLDMVCEKNGDVTHDFLVDPIRPRLDGEWVTATGTTLGADNGIGVAAALAAASDPSVTHGPLELLFTVDEETGLTGATNLDPKIVTGRTLLNLDSEEDGAIFVGCAGGADTVIDFDGAWQAPAAGSSALKLSVRGLRGGHSGLNIHEGRGNAIKALARILYAAAERGNDFELAALSGGSKRNAIPREAEALVHLSAAARAAFEPAMAEQVAGFRIELAGVDEGLAVALGPASTAAPVLTRDARDRLLRLLVALPHGVLAMSRDIPGLVETSSNLAVVTPSDGRFEIVTSSRSSVMPSMKAVLAGIRAATQLAGARAETQDGYPGWKPNMASPVLAVVRDVYRVRWGREPHVTAIHAGLECGLLGEKVPGLDMVSFGPQIEGAHSPDERVHIPSVERFWGALKEILERMSAG